MKNGTFFSGAHGAPAWCRCCRGPATELPGNGVASRLAMGFDNALEMPWTDKTVEAHIGKNKKSFFRSFVLIADWNTTLSPIVSIVQLPQMQNFSWIQWNCSSWDRKKPFPCLLTVFKMFHWMILLVKDQFCCMLTGYDGTGAVQRGQDREDGDVPLSLGVHLPSLDMRHVPEKQLWKMWGGDMTLGEGQCGHLLHLRK